MSHREEIQISSGELIESTGRIPIKLDLNSIKKVLEEKLENNPNITQEIIVEESFDGGETMYGYHYGWIVGKEPWDIKEGLERMFAWNEKGGSKEKATFYLTIKKYKKAK